MLSRPETSKTHYSVTHHLPLEERMPHLHDYAKLKLTFVTLFTKKPRVHFLSQLIPIRIMTTYFLYDIFCVYPKPKSKLLSCLSPNTLHPRLMHRMSVQIIILADIILQKLNTYEHLY